MAMGFGSAPGFDGLSPSDLSELIARLQTQQAPEQPAAPQQQAPVPPGLGSPEHLLFGREGLGGGLNPFMPREGTQQAAMSVPLPPSRPSDADLMAPAITGALPPRGPNVPGNATPQRPGAVPAPAQAASPVDPQPVSAFDPLSGQPVSGSPKPVAASSSPMGSFLERSGLQAAVPSSSSFLDKWKALADSGIGDQLVALGAGFLSGGAGKAFSNLNELNQRQPGNLLRQQLQALQIQQQLAGQQANRTYLQSKGVPDAQINAAVYNPAVLSSTLTTLGQKTPEQLQADARATSAGSMEGGQKPLDRMQAESRVQAAGKDEGSPDKPKLFKYKDEQGVERFLQQDPETGNLSVPKGAPDPGNVGGNPYATGKFNDTQGKAAGFSDSMLGAEQTLRKHETINRDAITGTIQGMLPNTWKGDDRQSYEQAKRSFTNARLRRDSGAAISQGEFDSADRQYFPQPGESPAIIAQKRQERQRSIEAMAREGGPAYRPSHTFGEDGSMVPYGQRAQAAAPARETAPVQHSRDDMMAEARRRGLIR